MTKDDKIIEAINIIEKPISKEEIRKLSQLK
jgi:hypothetical protein